MMKHSEFTELELVILKHYFPFSLIRSLSHEFKSIAKIRISYNVTVC